MTNELQLFDVVKYESELWLVTDIDEVAEMLTLYELMKPDGEVTVTERKKIFKSGVSFNDFQRAVDLVRNADAKVPRKITATVSPIPSGYDTTEPETDSESKSLLDEFMSFIENKGNVDRLLERLACEIENDMDTTETISQLEKIAEQLSE